MNANNQQPSIALRPVAFWLGAIRPRTLPLAFASVATGCFLAVAGGRYHWSTMLFALATALLLQVLSNLANDYGDAVKGTDNQHRTGPLRAVQSGRISRASMKSGIVVISALAFLSGCALVYVSVGEELPVSLVFFALGIGAIAAAIRYTIGSKAYGYKGLGDLFVFVFFGLVGVAGTCFLNTHRWRWDILLPAAAIGFLSAGVLNLNNMRDIDNDRASGKRTVAVFLGYSGARIYHLLLIVAAFTAAGWFEALHFRGVWSFLLFISLPFFARDVVAILRTTDKQRLDPFLRKLTLSSLLFSLLFGAGLLL